MHIIGVIQAGLSSEELTSLMPLEEYQLVTVKEKAQLAIVDGILLLEGNAANTFEIFCEWLIIAKEYPKAFVWIFAPESSAAEQKMYYHLGANGVIRGTAQLSELTMCVANTFTRFPQEQVQKKNNELEFFLNGHNLSIQMIDGEELSLTRLEYRLMELLYSNPNKAISYEQIYSSLWHDTEDNVVKCRVANLVFHLRGKLERHGLTVIRTVRSRGYMFVM